jgi:hypothetical protein
MESAEGEPEMKGWMTKRGAVRKNWSRRWFELRGPVLAYYRDEHATTSHKKGDVDLSRCSTCAVSTNPDAREHEFEIVSATRVYRFAAPDESSLERWVEAIGANIRQHGSPSGHTGRGGGSGGGGGGARSESGAVDEDDFGLFDAGVEPPSEDHFAPFALPGRGGGPGEEVLESWARVTLLQMDRSVRLCTVLLTGHRIALMYWADEHEPSVQGAAAMGGAAAAAELLEGPEEGDPFRIAAGSVRLVSLPVLAVRSTACTEARLGRSAAEAAVLEVLMRDSRGVRLLFDDGALHATGDGEGAGGATAAAAFDAARAATLRQGFERSLTMLRRALLVGEQGTQIQEKWADLPADFQPRELFAREYAGGFDAQGWEVWRSAEQEWARLGVGPAAEDPGPSGAAWRLHENDWASLCETYPRVLAVPASASDELVAEVGQFRSKGRIPMLSWLSRANGASITRCAQPRTGFTGASDADANFVQQMVQTNPSSRKLMIADARPLINAVANKLKGGGYENAAFYSAGRDVEAELLFFDIENIHAMRKSVNDMHSLVWEASKAGETDLSKLLSHSEDTRWLRHIQSVMYSVRSIVHAMAVDGCSVMAHCSDGTPPRKAVAPQ